MIIARAPLRIPIAGGGSDLPFYLLDGREGRTVTLAIDKYVYVTVAERYDYPSRFHYQSTEEFICPSTLTHPIAREVLSDWILPATEIHTTADIPANTGLGSSAAFTVALLGALAKLLDTGESNHILADSAYNVERRIGSPTGRQDHYASALGGLLSASHTNTYTDTSYLPNSAARSLADNLILVDTGARRRADEILATQARHPDKARLDACAVEAAVLSGLLRSGRMPDDYGAMMHEHWVRKRKVPGMSTPEIDALYARGLDCGATGGKLCGAGGGGFLLFAVSPERRESFIERIGSRVVEFRPDFEGVQSWSM